MEKPEFTIKDNIVIGSAPKCAPSISISKLLLGSTSRNPHFVAQIDAKSGEKLTLGQIKNRSIRCALWLKKQGIGKNDIVCVSTPNQINDCIPCIATFFVGAIFNPWYHSLKPAIARYFFEMMRPKIMFACEEIIDLLAQVANEANIKCKFVAYKNHPKFPSLQSIMDEQTQDEVESFKHVEPTEPKNQVAVIFFSSGTTGNQKGTMLSYDTLSKDRKGYLYMHENTNVLWYSPSSWITGTYFNFLGIVMPYTRIIHTGSDLDEICQVIEKYKVNWSYISPRSLIQMSKRKIFNKYDLPSLKTLMTTGSRCGILEEVQKQLPHVFVYNSYGMTELGGMILWKSINNMKSVNTVGHVIPGVNIKVADVKTGKAVGPNQIGEICCKTDNLVMGYYNKPKETKKLYDNEGWIHTGDLGYYDEDGEFTIIDRIEQVILSQNHYISPSQIEEILIEHPEVEDAAVISITHLIGSDRPLAFVVKVPGAKVTAEELIQLPATFNELFVLSGGIIFVDKIPYTSTGKKCVKDLKDMARIYIK